jgi:hypothetical protein
MLNDPMEAFFSQELRGESEITDSAGEECRRIIESAKRLHEQTRSHFAIVSFSTTIDTLPMWAYYADNFSGICMEFDSKFLNASFPHYRMKQVTYGEKPLPSMTFDDMMSGPETTVDRMSHKHNSWMTESEWRCVFDIDGKHFYLDDALKRVYLGPRIKEEHASKIKLSLADRHVEVMRPVINGFSMRFEVVQKACPLKNCNRTGAGIFNRDRISEDEISKFLVVPIDIVYNECTSLVTHPNVQEILKGCIGEFDGTNYVQLLARRNLRNGQSVDLGHLYDKNMHPHCIIIN